MKIQITLFLLLFLLCLQVQGQEDYRRNQLDTATDYQSEASEGYQQSSDDMAADFSDFPNLHPLAVHIPIMLLPLAALLQLIGFFVFKREISWIVLGIVIAGFLGAYAAANLTHPHTAELPAQIQAVYDRHDTYATWTLWLSGIAAVLKIVSHFLFKSVAWAEGITVAVLLASAYTVSVAGHCGSQLVYIEGVGPEGKYLESETGSHQH